MDQAVFRGLRSRGYAMVLNTQEGIPGDRQRFSAAHELGHLLMSFPEDCDPEKLCDRFAGAFLAPGRTVIREVGPTRHDVGLVELRLLKHKYGLSMQAWIHRLEELGVISPPLASRLRASFRGETRVKEPGPPVRQESPRRFRLLVARALAESVISASKASELLGGEPHDLSPAAVQR